MKRSRFTEEQITYALRQHEAGTPVVDVCRQLGVSEATFFLCGRRSMRTMGVAELREENAWLKRMVADLSLDKLQAHVFTSRHSAQGDSIPSAVEYGLRTRSAVRRMPI
jgi:putative transposase